MLDRLHAALEEQEVGLTLHGVALDTGTPDADLLGRVRQSIAEVESLRVSLRAMNGILITGAQNVEVASHCYRASESD